MRGRARLRTVYVRTEKWSTCYTEKWLRVLDLRQNSIGEAGRTALAEPLCKTPSSARGHRPNCPSRPSEGLGLACSNTRTHTHTHQPQYEYAYE